MTSNPAPDGRPAYLAGIACYVLWGLLPLYIHLLATLGVGSFELIATRALWSAPWAGALVLLARQGGQVAAVLAGRKRSASSRSRRSPSLAIGPSLMIAGKDLLHRN